MKLIISSQTSTAATWESISNLIPHFMIGTITYPCLAPDWLWTGFTSKLKQWHHITVITSQNTDNDCFFNYFLYVMAKQRNIEVLHYCPFVRRSISIVAEQVLLCSGSIYLHGTILIPASISNHIPSKVCDESTYPLSNFNCRNSPGTKMGTWKCLRVQGFMIDPDSIGVLKEIKLGSHDGNLGELFLFA